MEINYLAIGERIKKYRRERKIPQQKLAKLVGISVPHMCNIENGRTKFGLPILVALADAFFLFASFSRTTGTSRSISMERCAP